MSLNARAGTKKSIDELIDAVPPPEKPRENGPLENLSVIENALGTSLPKDIVEFGMQYGTGMFADTLEVYNPFSGRYLESVSQVSGCYRDLKRAEGDQFIPFEIYPKSPGLLVSGSDANGHMMFWLTEGRPEDWPLVLMTVDATFERLDMSITTFLARIFSGTMECILWDKEWIKSNFVGIAFHSK